MFLTQNMRIAFLIIAIAAGIAANDAVPHGLASIDGQDERFGACDCPAIGADVLATRTKV